MNTHEEQQRQEHEVPAVPSPKYLMPEVARWLGYYVVVRNFSVLTKGNAFRYQCIPNGPGKDFPTATYETIHMAVADLILRTWPNGLNEAALKQALSAFGISRENWMMHPDLWNGVEEDTSDPVRPDTQ